MFYLYYGNTLANYFKTQNQCTVQTNYSLSQLVKYQVSQVVFFFCFFYCHKKTDLLHPKAEVQSSSILLTSDPKGWTVFGFVCVIIAWRSADYTRTENLLKSDATSFQEAQVTLRT